MEKNMENEMETGIIGFIEGMHSQQQTVISHDLQAEQSLSRAHLPCTRSSTSARFLHGVQVTCEPRSNSRN